MIYVALLRARRTLTWSAIALAVIVVIVIVSFITNHVTMRFDRDPLGFPDSFLASAALFGALIAAALSATSLNREGPTLPIVWTKPVSRRRVALEYFAVDLAAVACVALMTAFAALLCALPTDALRHITHDPNLGGLIVRSLGVTFMWYAVVQAASAGLPGRGGMAIGLSWPIFSGLTGLAFWDFPGVHVVVLILNVINPLAWLTSTTHAAHGGAATVTSSLYPFLPDAVVDIAPWLLGALALYLATVLWSRREV